MVKIIQNFWGAIGSSNKTLHNDDSHYAEMSISEHLEELRYRSFLVLIFFTLAFVASFIYVKNITIFLQAPAMKIKFLQLAPGEYFFSSIKIAIFISALVSSPFVILQVFLFIKPGLTKKEETTLLPILFSSNFLFFSGIIFSYFILEPAALNFLIHYGDQIIEPIWSFEQYFDFTLTFLLSTGLIFQIPIIQIILGKLNIISSRQMLSIWRYVILLSTIVAAIITPSTDPFTQIILSLALSALYFGGAGFLFSINK